ncbi:YcgL domain-containing protein [Fulvimonas soli]|jgi:uncharacterized protein YcgL (UPF0745 family)|uniref:YcgL domain-containing protein n=1 Tax=Fulvimonas soli TaxID=155197 RepID=A0A316I8U3_9GAMM|nr:YcgL domain-containing protein [Fulvimonas soli]PWK86818.1 hypothetical protein C7456_107209 [Fulvimonas soli]TNY27194.1 hypothetical protein BV497_04795 [Fulvimonas soli]
MHCYVYASQHKSDTYVWLAARDDFAALPESLSLLLGDLRFVLEVELDERRQLPHEDSRVVLEHLRAQGWHLQLPPKETLAVGHVIAQRHGQPADDRDA